MPSGGGKVLNPIARPTRKRVAFGVLAKPDCAGTADPVRSCRVLLLGPGFALGPVVAPGANLGGPVAVLVDEADY